MDKKKKRARVQSTRQIQMAKKYHAVYVKEEYISFDL